MQLPSPLAPWRSYLAWFDDTLAPVVGALLRQLNALLGPVASPQRNGDAEFDGIDDLRRRGSYERLLLTEWAVADVEPDEFLRRAVSGEHVFLSPRRTEPRGDRRIVAVFDSGPTQLGAARVAQVALALLLKQRADRLGAEFCWGCLQLPTRLAGLEGPADLKSLLDARSLLPADPAAIDAWSALLDAAPAPTEYWLVGASAAVLPCTHRVLLRRRLDTTIDVEIAGPRGTRKTRLTPPPPATGARLLRGEFEQLAVPKAARRGMVQADQRFALKMAPRLDRRGTRIVLPLLEGDGLLQVRTSNSNAERLDTSVHRWREGATLLAPLFVPRGIGGVLSLSPHLRGWNLQSFKSWTRPPPEQLGTSPGQGRWLHGHLLNPGRDDARLLLLDNAGNLAEWHRPTRADALQLTTRKARVLALHPVGDSAALIACVLQGQLHFARITADGTHESLLHTATLQEPNVAFIAGDESRQSGQFTSAYAQRVGKDGGGSWKLLYRDPQGFRHGEANLPPGTTVLGLAVEPQAPERHALIGIDRDRRRIILFLPQPIEIHTSETPIVHASVCANGDRVALLTERRELRLIDVAARQLVLQLRSHE